MEKPLHPQSAELDEDRKALEHIARALSQPGLSHGSTTAGRQEASMPVPALESGLVAALLDALPSPIALLAGGHLMHGNPAFAAAFGYGGVDALQEAGGIDAVLPELMSVCENGEATGLVAGAECVSRTRIAARSAGGDLFDVMVELATLRPDPSLQLLRLIERSAQSASDTAAGAKSAESPQDPDPSPAASRHFNFLAKVSHEVRTPLNSILGFAELMIGEKLGEIGNPRYKAYIEDIHRSGRYALSLLNDLLDLSKIESGEFELDFTSVEVGEMADECLHLLQPMARRERILLRLSLEPDLPPVIADPRRLKQILLNLLSNAIKFTQEGGQVILSGSRTAAGGVRIRVRDTGVGMTPEEIQVAMQPFQQLDTTPRTQTGTGLGLPLTKALIEANRAQFMLSSEAGAGSSADVIFPLERLVTDRT